MKKIGKLKWILLMVMMLTLQSMSVCAEEGSSNAIAVTATDVTLDYETLSTTVAVVPAGLPAGTVLGALPTTNDIVSVQWLQPETYGYTYLQISAINPGTTQVLVYAMDAPSICTTINVTVASVVPTFTFSGTGNQVISGIGITSSLSYDFVITNEAERGAFNVYFNGPNGNELLVNTIGKYSGTVRLPAGDVFSSISVVSQGDWTITIKQVSGTSNMLLGGSGDKVSGWFEGTGTTANISIANDANKGAFTVWLYDSTGHRKLLVNKVGTYTGVVRAKLQSGRQYYVEVVSDGNWVVNFNQGTDVANMSILQ